MRKVLFVIAMVSGCGEPTATTGDDVPAGSTQEAIQGGKTDAKDPAVGLVWIKGGGFCSGTLIAPNVVLTAGHCVAEPIAAFYTGEGKGTATVGKLPAAGVVEHRVVAQIAHPSYRSENKCPNSTFDVGLLRLAAPIRDVAPLPVATTPPTTNEICRAVGYGVHDNPDGTVTIEQRRTANEQVESLSATALRLEGTTGIVDHGDSGGPLLCKQGIVGTTSCGNDDSPDHTEAYDARVDTLAAWIAQSVAAWQ